MDSPLIDRLRRGSFSKVLTDGKEYSLVPAGTIRDAAGHANLKVTDVELAALRGSLVPARYAQNIPEFGFDGQIRILESTVCVVGAGGVGGWVCELLARSGVGQIIVIDGDKFDETNLNRQVLCTESEVCSLKAETALKRISMVNSGAEVQAVTSFATPENLPGLLAEASVLLDCVDKGSTRLMLQRVAAQLGVPMVHASMGGFVGRVMTVFPGDRGVAEFYDEVGASEQPGAGNATGGPPVGSPGVTTAAIAPWQVAEALKIITGKGHILRNEMIVIDLWNGQAAVVPLWTTKFGKFVNRLRGVK